VKPKEKELREGINKCEEIIKQLEINSTTTQLQIHQLFNKIRSKLDEKEKELFSKLEEIEKYKKKELEIQKEELKFGIESIIGSCQMIEHSISESANNQNGNARLLSMKKLYESRLNYLSNNIWNIEPCLNPFIEFLISKKEESIYSNISNIGVIDSNEIWADKCLISRNEKQKIYENEEFKFEIISYSKEGNRINNGGNVNNFTIHIEEQKNEKQEDNKCGIVDLNNGIYEVKLKLKEEGKYLIFIEYDGININSSPFQIQVFLKLKQRNCNQVNQPKLTFGSNGNENGQFCYPYGVTINSKGNIIVSEYGNHRIQVFDSEGKFISTFGSHGDKIGQFNNPVGICIDKNDRIYVCEYINHRIQIFDSEGNFISTFGLFGNGNGQFNYPIGIAINSKGNIFVCDYGNSRIQIFDSQGKFRSTFGSSGKRNDQFNNPWGICVDLNDRIYVCDLGNNRVQIFNSNTEYLTQFKVNQPTNITIDPNTQDIIVTRYDNQVSIF